MSFTEAIGGIFKIIGFAIVCIGAYSYIYIPYIKTKEQRKQEFKFKVATLLYRHPVIVSMFSKFKKEEQAHINYLNKEEEQNEEYDEYGKSLKRTLHCLKDYRVSHLHYIEIWASSDYSADKFYKSVVEKIQELERNPKEREIISEIVRNEKSQLNKLAHRD